MGNDIYYDVEIKKIISVAIKNFNEGKLSSAESMIKFAEYYAKKGNIELPLKAVELKRKIHTMYIEEALFLFINALEKGNDSLIKHCLRSLEHHTKKIDFALYDGTCLKKVLVEKITETRSLRKTVKKGGIKMQKKVIKKVPIIALILLAAAVIIISIGKQSETKTMEFTEPYSVEKVGELIHEAWYYTEKGKISQAIKICIEVKGYAEWFAKPLPKETLDFIAGVKKSYDEKFLKKFN